MDLASGQGTDDSHLSMMERRPWKTRIGRILPLRYRDLLPETLRPAPPHPLIHTVTSVAAPHNVPESSPDTDSLPPSATGSFASRIYQCFKTQRNRFGLFREYHSELPPTHDPEEAMVFEDLLDDANAGNSANPPPGIFSPYPNRNAFLLGDWYWNGGTQKSQASFKDLVNIIGDPEFSSADVRDARWDHINHVLADDAGWVDEDAAWEKTPITILVPAQHRRNATPDEGFGPQEYTIPDFYHRNLVSVIREKLSNSSDNDHFHYDPYTLKFQPGTDPPINVHGEHYTSQSFIDAHIALQNSPPEPGCTLSRHVIALMFYSDGTHLTSFGNAKLWPVYLYFGNESKYWRSKPSCNLGNHVAYLQKVGYFQFNYVLTN